MADLKLAYQDATIDINAGFGGLHHVTVSCGSKTQVFDPDELNGVLMPILYPALKAWSDVPSTPTTPSDTAAS